MVGTGLVRAKEAWEVEGVLEGASQLCLQLWPFQPAWSESSNSKANKVILIEGVARHSLEQILPAQKKGAQHPLANTR